MPEITIPEVDRYRTRKLREGKLSPAITNKTITRLAQILELAVEYGYIQSNPASGKRRRAKADPPKPAWLEPDQVKPLIEAGHNTRAKALLATLTLAGPRIQEALELRWCDVSFASPKIRVGHSKTAAGVRMIDMSPALHDYLVSWKFDTPTGEPDDLVFGTRHRKPDTRQNVRKRVLLPAIERANKRLVKDRRDPIGSNITPHKLRYTFASLLFEAGASVPYVMDQLGHADPKVTRKIYAHVMRRQRDTGVTLDELVGMQGGNKVATQGVELDRSGDAASVADFPS